ncbi:hypothetical protein HDU67_010391, partial [Dinochytrium kinnereticum]
MILPALKRDFLALLPVEIVYLVAEYLDLRALGRCCSVSRGWRRVLEGDAADVGVWKRRLVREGWGVAAAAGDGVLRFGSGGGMMASSSSPSPPSLPLPPPGASIGDVVGTESDDEAVSAVSCFCDPGECLCEGEEGEEDLVRD